MSLVDCLVPHLMEAEKVLQESMGLKCTLQTSLLRKVLYEQDADDGYCIDNLDIIKDWSENILNGVSKFLLEPRKTVQVPKTLGISDLNIRDIYVRVPLEVYKDLCLQTSGVDGILNLQAEYCSCDAVNENGFYKFVALSNGIVFPYQYYEYSYEYFDMTDLSRLNGVFFSLADAKASLN